jgi:hypothetical protein
VRPTGAKLWRYRYRYTGKARMLALGEYPSVSLMDARGKRNEARAVLAAGIDPTVNAKAKRAAVIERAANTFAALASEWLAQNAHTVTPGTLRRDRRVFERHLNPWIGDTAIADVSPPMLLAALRKIESTGALETAHRARSCVPVVSLRHCDGSSRTKSSDGIDWRTKKSNSPTLCQHYRSTAGGSPSARY